MKKVLIVVLLAAVAGGGWAGWNRFSHTMPAVGGSDVPIYRVARRDIANRVKAIGILRARESRIISAPFGGKLVKLLPEGLHVEPGTVIAWMETTEVEDQVLTQEQELTKSEAELARAEEELRLLESKQVLDMQAAEARLEFNETRLEDARRKYEEQKVLVEKNLAAKNTLDDARLETLQAELSLRESRIELTKTRENQDSERRVKGVDIERARVTAERVRTQLKQYKDQIEKASIKANGRGFINYLYTWRGKRAKIAEGDQVWEGSSIIEIPDSGQIIAIVPINELDITRVDIGQPAWIEVAAIPGETFVGEVSKKGTVPLTEQSGFDFLQQPGGIKLFDVTIDLDGQDARFRQNMTATVEIETARAQGVVVVPLDAVFKEPVENPGDPVVSYVLVRGPGGEPERTVIQTGVQDDNFAEVTTSEPLLVEGAEVLLRDPSTPLPRTF